MLTLTLAGLAIRSAGLLALSLIALLIFRRASSSVRRLIPLAGMISVLVLPLVWWGTPAVPVSPSRIPGLAQAANRPEVSEALENFAQMELPTPQPTNVSAPIPQPKPVNPAALFLLLWAIATAGLLVRCSIGLAAAAYQIKRTSPFENPQVHQLGTQLGIRRKIRLALSSRLKVPATAGIFRPIIILPADAATWSDDKIGMALTHELAHIRQNDWLFSLAAQIACALYPFNPLVWICAHRFRRECEFAADDTALRSGFRPASYASQLLNIAREARTPSTAMLAMAATPRVEARLRAIVDPSRRRGSAAFPSIAAAAVIMAIVCGIFAAFRLGDPPQVQPQNSLDAAAFAPDGSEGWKGPLTVHVVNSQGRPCPGAKLCFQMRGSFMNGLATSNPPPVTDSQGNYQIRPDRLKDLYPQPNGWFKSESLVGIEAYFPGNAISVSNPIKKGDHAAIVQLGQSNRVNVPIVDQNGQHISGVQLTAKRLVLETSATLDIPKQWALNSFRAVSDQSGIAQFKDMPAGWKLNYSIDDQRFLPTEPDQDNLPIKTLTYPTLKLVPGATLQGIASLNGTPVVGLGIQANWAGTPSSHVGVTDANGHYQINRVPPGVCCVHYFRSGHHPGPDILQIKAAPQHDGLQVAVGQNITGLNFNFESGGQLTGRIVGKSNPPMVLEIEASTPNFMEFRDGGGRNSDDFFTSTNPKTGNYTLRVPAGHYRVRVGIGDPPPETQIDIATGQTVVTNFKIND